MGQIQKNLLIVGSVSLSIIGLGLLSLIPIITQTTNLSGFAATECPIDAYTTDCRVLLGATARNYPQAADETKAQILYHEQRIGRQLDIVHTYHPVGTNKLSDMDVFFATRANTYLFANWKPTAKWADAGGSNTTINAGIDQMADSIKSIAPKKIFMTINHEPENDVSSGGTCSSYKGSSGTTDQYKAMWQNVHNRFDAKGVTNVVWVMDYMNYAPWDCVVNQLYPGDNLVDWIMFNAYGQGTETWDSKVSHLYNFLSTNSNTEHNYLSKPWGIVEWSSSNSTVAQKINYFDQAKQALETDKFSKLKAYLVFDENDGGSTTGTNFRIAYDDNGTYQQTLQDHYNAFANSPKIAPNSNSHPTGEPSFTPSPTTQPTLPPVSPTFTCLGACPTNIPTVTLAPTDVIPTVTLEPTATPTTAVTPTPDEAEPTPTPEPPIDVPQEPAPSQELPDWLNENGLLRLLIILILSLFGQF